MRKKMRVITATGIVAMVAAVLTLSLCDTDGVWTIAMIMLVLGEMAAMMGFMWEVFYVLFKEIAEYKKLDSTDYIVSLFDDSEC